MTFLKIFGRFPKILQNLSEGQTNISEHFPRVSEDYRRCMSEDKWRFAKNFKEDPYMSWSYTNDFNLTSQTWEVK